MLVTVPKHGLHHPSRALVVLWGGVTDVGLVAIHPVTFMYVAT